ncbi:MAG: winged helix DNA-binding domain-containing protein [Microbacterium sp.]
MHDEAMRRARLRHHRLASPARSVTAAAQSAAATQSQDFWSGRLALALRTRDGRVSQVDRAYDRGMLVRTWSQRGTLHTVAAADVRWMLLATSARQLHADARRIADLGLDTETVGKAETLIVDALAGGNRLTRAEVAKLWEEGGVSPGGQRGYHLLFTLAVRGVLVWGPTVHRDGREPGEQYAVLLDEWVTDSASPSDPTTELFVRYVAGHGPATTRDFAWWSGLTLGAAREAAAAAGARVRRIDDELFAAPTPPRASSAAPRTVALPTFDEYYISYEDRRITADEHARAALGPGANGMVRPIILHDGAVVGIWKPPGLARRTQDDASFELFPGAPITSDEARVAVEYSMAALIS